MTLKKAFFWSGFWVAAAILFGALVWYVEGSGKALEFFTGYVLELSLSMDNIFVFLMIFSSFGIAPQYQRRALNWGIIGAMILRLIFILVGVALVERFEWILYIFGALLVITAITIIMNKRQEEVHPEENKVVQLFKRYFPVTDKLNDEHFFVRIDGVLHATPLFLVLLVIESSDIMFAIDSIPAIFSVTTDPFIIYTSNILAIVGLRSFYFVLERLQQVFAYLKQGVGVILLFTGIKMLLLIVDIHIPIPIALGFIGGVLIISILASLLAKKPGEIS